MGGGQHVLAMRGIWQTICTHRFIHLVLAGLITGQCLAGSWTEDAMILNGDNAVVLGGAGKCDRVHDVLSVDEVGPFQQRVESGEARCL